MVERVVISTARPDPSGIDLRPGGSTDVQTVEYTNDKSQSFAIVGGVTQEETRGVQRTTVPFIDENEVQIDGMTVSRAVYDTLRRSGQLAGHNIVDPLAASSFPEPGDRKDATPDAGQDSPDDQLTDEHSNAIAYAAATLAKVNEAIGSKAVEVAMTAALNSGDITAIPAGVSQAQADLIVAGYTASANRMLSGSGASVAMLNEALTYEEAAEARWAVVNADSSKLQALGELAVDRIAALPKSDPQAFAALQAELKHLSFAKGNNGEALVAVKGVGLLPWAVALRMRAVSW